MTRRTYSLRTSTDPSTTHWSDPGVVAQVDERQVLAVLAAAADPAAHGDRLAHVGRIAARRTCACASRCWRCSRFCPVPRRVRTRCGVPSVAPRGPRWATTRVARHPLLCRVPHGVAVVAKACAPSPRPRRARPRRRSPPPPHRCGRRPSSGPSWSPHRSADRRDSPAARSSWVRSRATAPPVMSTTKTSRCGLGGREHPLGIGGQQDAVHPQGESDPVGRPARPGPRPGRRSGRHHRWRSGRHRAPRRRTRRWCGGSSRAPAPAARRPRRGCRGRRGLPSPARSGPTALVGEELGDGRGRGDHAPVLGPLGVEHPQRVAVQGRPAAASESSPRWASRWPRTASV